MKNPHEIIIRPHITEKSVAQSYGDERAALRRLQNESKGDKKKQLKVTEEDLVRKYTFIVAPNANKIEIKQALEAIYNDGRKPDDQITVTSVHTVNLPRKKKRRGMKSVGYTSVRRKAIVTLGRGQMLEDYGV